MTTAQTLLGQFHKGELDENGIAAMLDAMQDEGDEAAVTLLDGYLAIKRLGVRPIRGGDGVQTLFAYAPVHATSGRDNITGTWFRGLEDGFWAFDGSRRSRREGDDWRDYDTPEECYADLARAWMEMTPEERKGVTELFHKAGRSEAADGGKTA